MHRLHRLVLATAMLLCVAPAARAELGLLVTSANNSRIVHYNGTTGAFVGLFADSASGAPSQPGGVVLGADGKLYVGGKVGAGYGVLRFNPTTGALIDVFSAGYPSTIIDLAFGPDGNLYGSLGPANLVFRADGTTGALLGYIGAGSSLNYVPGITFGPDHNLYVASFGSNQILRFNPTTGAFIDIFATVPVSGTGGNVGGVKFGADNNLYVTLPNTGNDIVRFDGNSGAFLGSFIRAGDLHPQGPRILSFGPDGNLYVPSRDGNEVLRYSGATGAFIDHFATRGLNGPVSLAFVPEPIGEVVPGPQPPLVDTTSGPIQGYLESGVLKYIGVPYAQAPVGALRWSRPVRRAASPTPIDASDIAACPQGGSGSEDCLRLSIWRPEHPTATPLPVLFYIHGGGLVTGSASGSDIDASDLARSQNLLVVEIQYRLGVLGFFGLPALAAEDPNASTGNYGFLDQLEALRWVRDNIAAFGGDPARVTIAGQSAGGHSVCVLMASPLSDGLFQGGIIHSGQCTNAIPLSTTPGSSIFSDPLVGTTVYDRSQAVAVAAGCPAGASQLACLRALPSATLVQALAGQPKAIDGAPPANPAIDGYVLSEQPIVMLRKGAADGRPLMVGSVANESTYFTVGLESLLTTEAFYELFVRFETGSSRTAALLSLFPGSSYPSYAEAFRTLVDDAGIVCRALDAADAIVTGGSPAWVYHLSFAPTYAPGSPQASQRTFHGLDLYYLFRTYGQLGLQTDADDAALSDSMQEAWGSFVRTGVPSTVPAWPPYVLATPGNFASGTVLQFDAPNVTTAGAVFRAGRCAAFAPAYDLLDPDRDVSTSDVDNCPLVANTSQADVDADGVGDACDNCTLVANADQRDTNHDGYGNACDADLNNDGIVNFGDLAKMKSFFFKTNEDADLDGDSVVNFADLAIMKQSFFKKPGPSGLACAGTLPCPAPLP